MRFDRKPPLDKSPVGLRPSRIVPPSRILRSSTKTPPGSLTKPQLPNSARTIQDRDLLPKYNSISSELRELAKKVQHEFRNGNQENSEFGVEIGVNNSCSMFERGKFYEEYSARRNERLKKKKGETGNEKKTVYDLGVKVESGKRRDLKKVETLRRKSIPPSSCCSVDRSENSRYSLRSNKEMKKPPLYERSVVGGERKMGTRRVRKI